MNTKDIYARINQILVEKTGGFFKDKYEQAKYFDEAMMEYLLEKLPKTKETEVMVLDYSIIFDVFDRFFTSQQEQQEFYRHIVHSYVYALSDLTGEALLWEIVDDDEKGDFPRITGEYTKFIQTKKNQSHKETALWISSLYKQKQQKPIQKNLQQ